MVFWEMHLAFFLSGTHTVKAPCCNTQECGSQTPKWTALDCSWRQFDHWKFSKPLSSISNFPALATVLLYNTVVFWCYVENGYYFSIDPSTSTESSNECMNNTPTDTLLPFGREQYDGNYTARKVLLFISWASALEKQYVGCAWSKT